MTSITQKIGYGDIILHRGVTEHIGVHWTQDLKDGRGPQPVDLEGWYGRYLMLGPQGQQWYTQTDLSLDSQGVAAVTIPANAFTDDQWAGRVNGEWRILATAPDTSRVEMLGWGHYQLTI